MKVTRREFLNYCTGSAAALGLLDTIGPLQKVLASTSGPPVIWIKGASCTGCTVSLSNLVSSSAPTDLADLLIHTVDLVYHPTVMGAAGDLAVQTLRNFSTGNYILIVEGGIPTLYGGKTCTIFTENGRDVTALEAVQQLAPKAMKVISVGSCAAFGGMSGASPNPTGVESVAKAAGVSTINVPGCPPHPDWMVWTIAQLLAGASPALDSYGRPTALYGRTVHSQCSRIDKGWASSLSQTGLCNGNLGCKGRRTHADCPTRLWNNHTNWCVGTISSSGNGADSLCQGCTEIGFPDAFSPLFSTRGAQPYDSHDPTIVKLHCTSCHTSGRPD
jgi:hydrogenase small subunit